MSEADIQCQRRVKQTFDPHGLANPGKMFPAPEEVLCAR
jgi:FAD/FMN-containing dehydrogenase